MEDVFVGLSLVDGVEVAALDVLDEGQLQHLLVINLADDDGDFLQTRPLAGLIAALARYNLVAFPVGPHQDGLEDPHLADRIGKLVEFVLVKVGSGLVLVAVNLT